MQVSVNSDVIGPSKELAIHSCWSHMASRLLKPAATLSTVALSAFALKNTLDVPRPESRTFLAASATLHNRWADKWDNNQLGWHKQNPHETIVKHVERLNKASSVLVPLCGKTVDLHYLSELPHIKSVVGVEGVEKACNEFCEESGGRCREIGVNEPSGARVFGGSKVELMLMDFFDLPKTNKKFEAVWDRASIVAIEPSLREKYVQVLGDVCSPGAIILLSTFDRRAGTEEAVKGGPPFSVSEADVVKLFGCLGKVEKIDEINILTHPSYKDMAARFKAAGLTDFREGVYIITVNGEDEVGNGVFAFLKKTFCPVA